MPCAFHVFLYSFIHYWPNFFSFTSVFYVYQYLYPYYLFIYICILHLLGYFFIWWSQWLLIYLLYKYIELLCVTPLKYSYFFPFSKILAPNSYRMHFWGLGSIRVLFIFVGRGRSGGICFMVLFLRFFGTLIFGI